MEKPLPTKAEKQQPTVPPKVQPTEPKEPTAPIATPVVSKPAPPNQEALPASPAPAVPATVPKDAPGTVAPPAAATVSTKAPGVPPVSAALPKGAAVAPKEQVEAVAPQKTEAEKAVTPPKAVEPEKFLAEPAQTNIPTAELKQAVAVPQVEQVAHAMSGDFGVLDVDVCTVRVLDVVGVIVREDDRDKEVLTEEPPDTKGEIMEPVDRPTGDSVITEGVDDELLETVDKSSESVDTSTESMSSELSLEERSQTEVENADLVSDAWEKSEFYDDIEQVSDVQSEELTESELEMAEITSGIEGSQICDESSGLFVAIPFEESAVQNENVELAPEDLERETHETIDRHSEMVSAVLSEQECESHENYFDQISEVLLDEPEMHDASQVIEEVSVIISEECELYDGNVEPVSEVYVEESEQYTDTAKHISNYLEQEAEIFEGNEENTISEEESQVCNGNAEHISKVFVQETELNVEGKEIKFSHSEQKYEIHVENPEIDSVGSEVPVEQAEVCIGDAEQVSDIPLGEKTELLSEAQVIDPEMCTEKSEMVPEMAYAKEFEMYAECTDSKTEGLVQKEDVYIENKEQASETPVESEIHADNSELLSEVVTQEPDRKDIIVETGEVMRDTSVDKVSEKNENITEHVIYTKDYAFTHSIVDDQCHTQEEKVQSVAEPTVESFSNENNVDTFSNKVDEKFRPVEACTGDSTTAHVLLETQKENAEGTSEVTVERPPDTSENSVTSVGVSTDDIVCTEVLVEGTPATMDKTAEVMCHNTISNEQKENKEVVEIPVEDSVSVEILEERTSDMKENMTHPVEICTQQSISTVVLLEEVSNTQEEKTDWTKIPSSEYVSVEVSLEELSDTQEEHADSVEPSTEESVVKVNFIHCRMATVLECIDDVVRNSCEKRLNMLKYYDEAYSTNCFIIHLQLLFLVSHKERFLNPSHLELSFMTPLL